MKGLTAARTRNRDMEIAIGISVGIHVLLLTWLVWQWGTVLAGHLVAARREEAREEEVTLLYPDQVVPVPPPKPKPKLEPQQYIRTTQNVEVTAAPAKADFISDRNTVAASVMPADPNGESRMPTQEGIDPVRLELANRDHKDGEIKEDGATPVPEMRASTDPVAASAAPLSVLKPTPERSVPAPAVAAASPPPTSPPPVEVARTELMNPLEAMMRERDESDAARITTDRLPLEVKTALMPEEKAETEKSDPNATPELPVPVRPASEAPAVPKAIALPVPVKRTAGPQDAEAFSPFTQTSKARGTISNRGEAAVNAAETPVGRYMRAVTGAVEKKWHLLRRRNADAVTFGELQLRFFVRPDGGVEPPTILSDRSKADPRMVDFTLQAILEAEIPPIPQDLLPLLDHQRLEVEYDVLIY
jgi:hypothetical protein